MAEDILSWAAREGLSEDTVEILLNQHFNSVDDLKRLSPEDIIECFQKPRLLTLKECLALTNAIFILSHCEAPTSPTSLNRKTPPVSPTDSQNQGRGQPDFEPQSGFENLSLMGSHADPVSANQPKPGYVKGTIKTLRQYLPFQGSAAAPRKVHENFRLLMLGKTGSGKSTTGNTILGEDKFKTGMKFCSVTTVCDLQRVTTSERFIEIKDCPGLYDTHQTEETISSTIVQAVACMHPGPHVILYIIRVGRYTPEEFGVFKRLKALFDDDITKYMIVLFTGGDDLEREKSTLADLLKEAPKELIQVVTECGHRCHVFNNIARNKKDQVEKLLEEVRRMQKANDHQPCYNCPKYAFIGEGLEKEVKRRLAEVEKKDPAREQQFIQQLEAQKRIIEDLQVNMQKIEERLQLEKSENDRMKEGNQLAQELKDQDSFTNLTELLQKYKEDLKQTQEEKEKLEKRRVQEKREEQERREKAYQEEINRMKDAIANKEKQGWIDWAAGGVAKVIAAPFKAVASVFY